MKKGRFALAVLLLIVLASDAQADMELYIARDTVTAAQGETLARMLAEETDERIMLVTQEADGRDFEQRMMDGEPPHLAIVRAGNAAPWAREGCLASLNRCAPSLESVAEAIVDACMAEEQLYALPLIVRRHKMAVRTEGMEEIGMGTLLDEQTHPVWVPSQVLQVLDELRLCGSAGLEIWRPTAQDALGMEAFLQGTCGVWIEAGAADERAIETALIWLDDLVDAGMIGVAEDREAALARFLSGETTIFIDWTMEESSRYAKELKAGQIVLLPYPSAKGMATSAADVIVLCAPRGSNDRGTEKAVRAAAGIAALMEEAPALGERLPGQDGEWLYAMETLEHGPTLRALICEAAGEILSGETSAQAAAMRIARAMDTATH